MLHKLFPLAVLATLATAFAPSAAAHYVCCEPTIHLGGLDPDPWGDPDWPIDEATLTPLAQSLHESAIYNAWFLADAADSTLQQAAPIEFDPLPPPDPDYTGHVLVDVTFPEECNCEILYAYLTQTDLTAPINDGIDPVILQVDYDTWDVSAPDFDTYEITFHVVYDCGQGPQIASRSWIHYN